MIPIPLLLQAYQTGFFPMGMEDGSIRWFSPDPRGTIPLHSFHAPKRLQRVVRQGRFEVAVNRSFRAVIEGCAEDRDDGTWITRPILETYLELHRLGFAHTVETWQDGVLVGGLYGVSLRGAFFGESMFSRVTDASKVALAALVDRLKAREYLLLDVQWVTPHLERFGAVDVPRRDYLRLLKQAMMVECRFADPASDRLVTNPRI